MAGIKLNTELLGSITLQPENSATSNVLVIPAKTATLLDTVTLAQPNGAELVGYDSIVDEPETVQSRLRLHDTQFNTIETLMDYSRLPFAAEPLSNFDLLAVRQSGANKRIRVQTVRTEFAADAIAAQQAAELARDEANVARDAAVIGAKAALYTTTAAGLAATTVGQFFNVISNDNKEYLNLYRHDAGPTATLIKTYPSVKGLEYEVAQTFYVTSEGLDTNTGRSINRPFRTINAAIDAVTVAGGNSVIIVHPGTYVVQPDTIIPQNTTLYGYDLRVTTLKLPDGQEVNNMFMMSNGIKVRGFTFSGLKHEIQIDDLAEPPQKGWAFVFKDNEFITRSPYISDCSQLHDFSYTDMSSPIDKALGNPLMPRGGGNILADGSVLSPYSPLRSVVVDSFTAINPNGIGYAIVKNAFVQLVSVFTNWSRVGIWSHLGGHVTIANSNNTFGDYAFASTGYRNTIKIEGVTQPQLLQVYATEANTLQNATESIITNLMSVRFPSIPDWTLITSNEEYVKLIQQTEKDTRQLLQQIIFDLRSGQDRGIQFFIKGLFDWNANYVFRSEFINLFVACWEQIRLELVSRISNGGTQAMINALIALVKDVIQNPDNYKIVFTSLIEAASQQFSYAGSGVNYNAIPYSQRGTGIAPDPTTAILQIDGGRIYSTFSTEQGDTYLGTDLRVDFERNTIEGQSFSRGVQNIALPLIISFGA